MCSSSEGEVFWCLAHRVTVLSVDLGILKLWHRVAKNLTVKLLSRDLLTARQFS